MYLENYTKELEHALQVLIVYPDMYVLLQDRLLAQEVNIYIYNLDCHPACKACTGNIAFKTSGDEATCTTCSSISSKYNTSASNCNPSKFILLTYSRSCRYHTNIKYFNYIPCSLL